MKASYKWLKRYFKGDISADDLMEGLTMSGSEVGDVEKVGDDTVLEMEITTNRPDCLNMTGLAREVSAVFDTELVMPGIPPLPVEGNSDAGREISCNIEDKDNCSRYTCRIITGVKVGEATKDLTDPLKAVGTRSVNNIVDVTNYCLLELGQPMHAFDLDKIKGGKVVVRQAKKGEKIVTLDGIERTLEPGMLIVADAERPIAIAGIMGGKETEVSGGTSSLLLESAYFDPVSIRRTARKLGISTDSSYRFERGVDRGMVLPASHRAARMIQQLAGGKIGELIDEGVAKTEDVEVELGIERTGALLGADIPKKRIISILQRLGMDIVEENEGSLVVRIPSFREDIRQDVDLVEEIARIYGYHNIPATLGKIVPQVERKSKARLVTEKIKDLLAAAGMEEIVSYSLISGQAAQLFREISDDPVEMSRYLSEEHKVLAPTLLDGMLKAVAWNLNRKNEDLAFFEIGRIYKKSSGERKYAEHPTLCMGMTGALRRDWEDGERMTSVFDLKGRMDMLCGRLGWPVEYIPGKIPLFKNAAKIIRTGDEKSPGVLGELSKKVLDEYNIEKPVFILQVELDSVLKDAQIENRYVPVPKFPISSRDISILCERSVCAKDLIGVMEESKDELVRGISLSDVYEGKSIPAGKVSYTYTIEYGAPTRTLTDDEVEQAHDKIKKALLASYNISFR